MAIYKLVLPKMGESVAEATIVSWIKSVGDAVVQDEEIVEVATDKVNTEVPSEVSGTIVKTFFEVDQVAQIGDVLAHIETTDEVSAPEIVVEAEEIPDAVLEDLAQEVEKAEKIAHETVVKTSERFYSPLVKNIAQTEGISEVELLNIVGSGKDGRVTKNDILEYLEGRTAQASASVSPPPTTPQATPTFTANTAPTQGEERIEMGRMERLIADHMTNSLHTSAHVQSFIEVDVTDLWEWRLKVRKAFEQQEGERLTFTPVFMQIVAKVLREFPGLNISVEGHTIIKKKAINLGMATALPDGNLIVPVIKNADQLSLLGMVKIVNDLANRARHNQLKPDEVKEGTFTVTNVGAFGSLTGTPIINQPQVGILAIGAIRKEPAVIETNKGDFIGIRHKMMLSHSYDHRVVNGAQGGLFIKRIKEELEAWDPKLKL